MPQTPTVGSSASLLLFSAVSCWFSDICHPDVGVIHNGEKTCCVISRCDPISTRINFKIATLTYNTLSSGHPAYLRELISPYQPLRSLRSSSQLLLTVPRASLTIGQASPKIILF